jgi:hypothetical protein
MKGGLMDSRFTSEMDAAWRAYVSERSGLEAKGWNPRKVFEAGYISSFAKYRDGEVRASGWVGSDED